MKYIVLWSDICGAPLIPRCPKHVLILPEGQSSTVHKSDGIHIFSGCIFFLNKILNKKVLLDITWYKCMARGFLLQSNLY